MSVPPRVTRPALGSRNRSSTMARVVFPAPLGPTTATRRPAGTVRSIPLSTSGPAASQRADRPSIRRSYGGAGAGRGDAGSRTGSGCCKTAWTRAADARILGSCCAAGASAPNTSCAASGVSTSTAQRHSRQRPGTDRRHPQHQAGPHRRARGQRGDRRGDAPPEGAAAFGLARGRDRRRRRGPGQPRRPRRRPVPRSRAAGRATRRSGRRGAVRSGARPAGPRCPPPTARRRRRPRG